MTDRRSRRILVTGASRGLGRALAVHLRDAGHHVVATARNPHDLADLDGCARVALDVTDAGSVAAAVAAAGPVDVLVNNAAVTVRAAVEALSDADVTLLWETNVAGPLRLARAVLPAMRDQRHGTIVNVSSLAAAAAPPLQSLYAATKAALDQLSDGLRYEVAPFGVTVVTATLGPIATGFSVDPATRTHPVYSPLEEQIDARQRAFAASDRPMTPDRVAADLAAAALAADPPARVTIAPTPIRILGRLTPGLLSRLMTRGVQW